MEVESSGSSSKDIKLGVRVPKIGDYPSGSSEESSRAIPFMTYSTVFQYLHTVYSMTSLELFESK
jgi:hypothetical protein